MNSSQVYVVDGDPAVRDSLSTLLDLNGYDVSTFSTGSAFLNALEDAADIQCVVCEAELPDTAGIQVFKRLQDRGIPVAFALLVSQRNPTTINAARLAGIDQVFPKPLVYRNIVKFVSSNPQHPAAVRLGHDSKDSSKQ